MIQLMWRRFWWKPNDVWVNEVNAVERMYGSTRKTQWIIGDGIKWVMEWLTVVSN